MSRARGNPLWIFHYTEEKLAWRNFSRDSRATRTTSKQKLRKKIYRSCQPFASLWDFLCENNFHASARALSNKQKKNVSGLFYRQKSRSRLKSATTRCFAFTWTMMQLACGRLSKKKWKKRYEIENFLFSWIFGEKKELENVKEVVEMQFQENDLVFCQKSNFYHGNKHPVIL